MIDKDTTHVTQRTTEPQPGVYTMTLNNQTKETATESMVLNAQKHVTTQDKDSRMKKKEDLRKRRSKPKPLKTIN